MRICFIGDSFVNGTGDPECLGWTGRICVAAQKQGYDVTYYNLGVRRETSADIKARWLQEVSCRLSPADDGRVVFSFGTNDTTIETDKTRIEFVKSTENTRQILQVAKQRFPVLMVGAPPLLDTEQNSRTARLLKQFEQICLTKDIPYLDIFTPLQKSQIWLQEVADYDGAHPRAAGYQEIANSVQNWSGWQSWLT
ncbi:lipase [Chroococcidiopsis sp. CCALA 051]|uniref:GDSL-type esterase/lipase family protein n=1 Tax=Chroococcidiopsis sp. CCALA 051 TaxID=869949 RepID=UPI000D0D1449|nr:GDSL-type esterase/lipase family protein [Chroococcidiopsis sp. CCALA 051]PSM48050.1 lipase [Chroococcidiopsis sp. CCALA 051]